MKLSNSHIQNMQDTLTIIGVNPEDKVQDVVGNLIVTKQGASEVLSDINEWLEELRLEELKVKK